MFTVNLKMSLARGLFSILKAIPPGKITTLEIMDTARKCYQKFGAVCESLQAMQKEIDVKVKEYEKKYKETEGVEAKAAVEAEANAAVPPLLAARGEKGIEIVSVELSDEQIEFLRSNFKTLIADQFTSIEFALEAGEALGVTYEKVGEKKA